MKWGTGIVLAVVVAAAGVASLGVGEANKSTADDDKPVKKKQEVIAGIGYVEPASEVRRLSFAVDGVIDRCLVDVNQQVKPGQTLMVLRSEKEKSAVELAKRELDLAKADRRRVLAGIHAHDIEAARRQCELAEEKLRYAKVEHDRVGSLRRSNSASASDADKGETEIRQAKSQLLADQARLQHLEKFVRPEDVALADARVNVAKEKQALAEKQLDDTVLKAPASGAILEILKREGDGASVASGQPAVLFGDLSRLRVRAEIDERHVHALTDGMAATVTGRPLNYQQFQGKVVRVNRVMGPKTVFSRAADERMDLDVVQILIDMGPDFRFPAGLRVDVLIEKAAASP